MHMADALISPAVGGAMWAATAAVTAHCARQARAGLDDRKAPLMGVLGAFVFAAQMINFTIPLTGSSGHLGGGLLLAILLGPHAAFLTLASVLTVQALFFADGGLLALGCNIFNLGFFPCFIAYPLLYRRLAGKRPAVAALAAAVVGLQLGALGVITETVLSGRSELPFRAFSMLMLPIHLAIGVAEGLATAAVAGFVRQARPELLALAEGRAAGRFPLRRTLAGFGAATLMTAGVLSWFASQRPDGLEWAIARATGKTELAAPESKAAKALEAVQARTAIMPDYDFKPGDSVKATETASQAGPAVSAGTSVAGVVGVALTLGLVGICGALLRGRRIAAAQEEA